MGGVATRRVVSGSGSSLLIGASFSVLAACSDPPALELGQRQLDIIRGVPAASADLDHTGALLYHVRSSGAEGILCSATLIGPETLVTAKHCVAPLVAFERVGIDVSWARGPDFNTPLELVPIAAFARSPIETGGAFGYGSDVAIIHLERPVAVTPAVVKPFTAELLGQSFITLGYGISTPDGVVDGLRRSGSETVTAVHGNIYEALFGDFETFVEWWVTGLTSDADFLELIAQNPGSVDLGALSTEYASWVLLDQHEAVAGTKPGDTQSCTGDSGGPLATIGADGRFETYAVVSGGASSARSVCDFGQVFATFGPVTFPFVEAAAGWTDPCADVDARGDCDGNVARRCETSFANAVRRLVERDCGALGQRCVMAATGAECGEPEGGITDAGASIPSDAAADAGVPLDAAFDAN
jgi:trypsin